VNICPYQGSRTIRTEEAVLIGLAKFSPLLAASVSDQGKGGGGKHAKKPVPDMPLVEFTDDEPSEESSGGEEE
jgi:hypothetical protein